MKRTVQIALIAILFAGSHNARSEDTPATPASDWTFPKDPDILGFRLLMSADEVQSKLLKDGFKIDLIRKTQTFTAMAARRAAQAEGKKLPPKEEGTAIEIITALKLDDGLTIRLDFMFLEDVTLTPTSSKCHRVSLSRQKATRDGPDPDTAEARAIMKAAVIEKYGAPPKMEEEDYLFYPGGTVEDRRLASNPNEKAPDFRFIEYSKRKIAIQDLGYRGRATGLIRRKLEDITESLKKEAPKAKL